MQLEIARGSRGNIDPRGDIDAASYMSHYLAHDRAHHQAHQVAT
jgi:hypothetical protein